MQAVDAEGRAHFRRFAFRSHQRGNNNQKKVPEIARSKSMRRRAILSAMTLRSA
jgi:hypothetical protein